MAADNKNWAEDYIHGPLHEPTPAEETGLNARHRLEQTPPPKAPSAVSKQTTGSSVETNPFRRGHKPSTSASSNNSPPPAASPPSKNGSSTPVRALSNGSARNSGPNTSSKSGFVTTEKPLKELSRHRSGSGSLRHNQGPPPACSNHGIQNRPRRSSSLRERYPNDPSVHPLDQITKEMRAANRSPHLKAKHHHGSDSIDKLDVAGVLGTYHHEGPYDAASLARNNTRGPSAPIEALRESNAETLRATPREAVQDSLDRHRPLDNVASVPPGERDGMGRQYRYRQGLEEDMMRNGNPEGGAYKRWEGIEYHPDDLKGKGEPSYSVEKGVKDHAVRGTGDEADPNAVELVERTRGNRAGNDDVGAYESGEPGVSEPIDDWNGKGKGKASATEGANGHKRETSGGFEGLKRRIGSLRKKD